MSLILFATTAAQSPTSLENLRNVLPPSPNSSAFAKYGEWPVNLYTGVPSISIPITSLKGRSMEVQVSLSYHASGNKVGEVASWVGLGWSLNAGGVITRSVRGLEDEAGYFSLASEYSNPNDLSSTVPSSIDQSRIVGTADNTIDSEQDVYYLNALGKSFRLLIKADGSVLTVPYSNVKFVSNPIVGSSTSQTNNEWIILMEDGTKLWFGGSTSHIERTDNPGYQATNGNGIQFISSWQLNTITSPSGETIRFTYTVGSIDQDSYFSQSDEIKYRASTTLAGPGSTCANIEQSSIIKSTLSRQQVSTLSLASIESDLQRIDFIAATDRQDMEGGSRLSEIKMYSKYLNQFTEHYVLNTSYSHATASQSLPGESSYHLKRLRLDSFERRDILNANTTSQKWLFEYNPLNLPSRRSFAQDHWGYYNGAIGNTTLLPRIYFALPDFSPLDLYRNLTGFMPQHHDLGGVRTSNGFYMQAEMLTKITYPTGGFTQFNFEPNNISGSKELFEDETDDLYLYLTNGQANFNNSRTTTFTLAKPSYVRITLESEISANVLNDIPSLKVKAVIKNSTGTAIASVFSDGDTWFNILSAGTYTFELSSPISEDDLPTANHTVYGVATIQYPTSIGTTSTLLTGGLRVCSIVDFDGATEYSKRYFQYSQPLVINGVDEFNDYVTIQTSNTYDGGNGERCNFVNTIRNSSTKFSVGTIQGGTTGYGQVKTMYGPNGENGYTISYFNSVPDEALSIAPYDPHTFPYPPAVSRDNRRGLLLRQQEFNAQHKMLKQVENTYSFISRGSIIGFKAGYSERYASHNCIDPFRNCGITRAFYGTDAEQVNHLTSTETLLDKAEQISLVTTTIKHYDNPLNTLPIRTVTTNSKGENKTVYSRTVLEKNDINTAMPLSVSASEAIDAMIEKNMVGLVLQQEQYVGSALLDNVTTDYKVLTSMNPSIVVPEFVRTKIGTNPPEVKIQFLKYDTKGNVLEQAKINDVPKAYVWGYGDNYPIAEIVNAKSTDVFYTSFEDVGEGSASTDAKTGDNSRTGGYNRTLTGLTNGSYLLSYWKKSGGIWTYQFSTVAVASGTYSIIIPSSEVIDEVRFHPVRAQMTTYTYKSGIGVSTISDANGVTTYYEYDSTGRLNLIKDDAGNIVKTWVYNYKSTNN